MKLTLALLVVTTLIIGISCTTDNDPNKFWKDLMSQVNKKLGKNYLFVEKLSWTQAPMPGKKVGVQRYNGLFKATRNGVPVGLKIHTYCPVTFHSVCTVDAAKEVTWAGRM